EDLAHSASAESFEQDILAEHQVRGAALKHARGLKCRQEFVSYQRLGQGLAVGEFGQLLHCQSRQLFRLQQIMLAQLVRNRVNVEEVGHNSSLSYIWPERQDN